MSISGQRSHLIKSGNIDHDMTGPICVPSAMVKVLQDNPGFRVVVKKAPKADRYKGLTYDFMEKYIASHDNAEARMAEFADLRATSDEAVAFGAEALSYGEIKAWFFKNYPEIEAFQKRREGALAA